MLAHGQGLAAAGIEVTFIPTWGCDQAMEDKPGGDRLPDGPRGQAPTALADVPGFAGSIVVGMCNSHVTACRKIL